MTNTTTTLKGVVRVASIAGSVWLALRCLRSGKALGVLAAAAALTGTCLAARKRHAAPQVRDEVDIASEQSFPASDPPAWTAGVAGN